MIPGIELKICEQTSSLVIAEISKFKTRSKKEVLVDPLAELQIQTADDPLCAITKDVAHSTNRPKGVTLESDF